MIKYVLFSSAYSSSVLVYIFGLLRGRHSYLWAETSRTGIPDLFFLAPFHSRDRAPPAINSPAAARRLIKRERLVHNIICVE